MKIAVNTRFLLKNKLEGMGLFAHEVLRRMVRQHPEHEFIFFFDRPYDASFIYEKNIRPVVLFPPARHPFLFVWWFEGSVARALKKYRAEVFLSPDNFLALNTKVKTVLVTHDLAHVHFPGQLSFFHRKYYEIMAPRFNRRADHIVAVSEFTKADITAQYGISQKKISVACNGCPEGFRPVAGEEKKEIREQFAEGEPYFFYVGAVHPRKNVHRLIAAFDRFKTATQAPVKLLIAGRFAWKAGEVKKAFDGAAHQTDIRFLGYVSDADLKKLMAGALACTYVSLFEGFGIPLLQAMHSGVPIITSDVSSMPEVAGRAGILTDPLSVEKIAEAMQQIWQDAHLRKRLVEEGKRQQKKFTWDWAAAVVWESIEMVSI
ncbi:MAG TPA: glycosyltransferase family 1 protein [Bacteroidetes bacterium]|nr:glycosyltransferase family 1 protein [Bacteroidota bacterium]